MPEKRVSASQASADPTPQGAAEMLSNFRWADFWHLFPYADLESSQGEYKKAVQTALKALSPKEQGVLLDLLDLQWVAYLEQLAILSSRELLDGLEGLQDTVATRLQIHSNFRDGVGARRDMRRALLKIPPGGVLDKLCE